MAHQTEPLSWIVILTASGLLCLSAYSLIDAIAQAHSTGVVEVFPRARRLPRERVPWPQAWAYFLGALAFVVASVLWLFHEFRRASVVLEIIAIYVVGVHLFMLSGNLASLAGTAGIVGLLFSIAAAFLVSHKFGRVAGLWFWAALVVSLLAFGLSG
jgi:hypothetical protein